MTDEAWIEQSLARLETLEAQKAQHEAAGEPVPPQIQEEIATLYEALESEADDGDTPPAEAPPAAAAPAAAPDDPFAAPVMAPAAAAPAAAPPVMAPMDDYGDDDFKPKGNGGLLAVAVVALLAAGGGGYWYMTQQAKPAPAPEPVGEEKVIGASSVPEDTQEPQAAKGGSADRTPGTKIPEGTAAPKRSGHGGGGGKKRPRNTGKKKNDGRKVDISDSRDPLAGI
ncbi:MAG: hypothetical protein ACRBN8_28135 [Nannocystales bacterium]